MTSYYSFNVLQRLTIIRRYATRPILNEGDLIEKFVRGSGPGGQATNKNSNAVDLRHVPTGLRVWCHHSRSLESNRSMARKILIDKLDVLYNGSDSKQAKRIEKKRKQKANRAKKSKKKYANAETNEEIVDMEI